MMFETILFPQLPSQHMRCLHNNSCHLSTGGYVHMTTATITAQQGDVHKTTAAITAEDMFTHNNSCHHSTGDVHT